MYRRDMDSEQVRKLVEAAPTFYGNVHYGFQCGPGWFSILEKLGRAAEPTGVKAHTVKEKFGGLRVYTDRSDSAIVAAVREAEKESLRTCEQCGQSGKHRVSRGWEYVSCAAHTRT